MSDGSEEEKRDHGLPFDNNSWDVAAQIAARRPRRPTAAVAAALGMNTEVTDTPLPLRASSPPPESNGEVEKTTDHVEPEPIATGGTYQLTGSTVVLEARGHAESFGRAAAVTLNATAEVLDERNFNRLMGRVLLLETTFARLGNSLETRPARAGDNNSPTEPVGMDDLLEVNRFIDLLKAEREPSRASDPTALLDAQEKSSKVAKKIAEYMDNFGAEASKAAGKSFGEEIGKKLANAPFWIALICAIVQVSEALTQWLNHVP